jgi:uncharacterized protein
MISKQVTQFQTPLWRDRCSDGSGFAFNPTFPMGVKYLSRTRFERLDHLISRFGSPPALELCEPIDDAVRELSQHGLCSHRLLGDNTSSGDPPLQRTLTVWLHIANSCNLACSYCYIPGLHKGANPAGPGLTLMPTELGSQTLRSLVAFCSTHGFSRLQVKFAGGEPTLHPELVSRVAEEAEALSITSGVAIDLRMITNGLFDDRLWVDIILRHRIAVSISVDGAPDDHDRVRFALSTPDPVTRRRRREGTWSKVASTIRVLTASGTKPYLLCTVTRSNYEALPEFVEHCRDRKIGFRLSPVRDSRSYAAGDFQDRLTHVLHNLYSAIGDSYPIDMPIERFARFAEWNLGRRKDIACGSCRSMLAVNHTGAVSSCQMRMASPSGSIQDGPLDGAFSAIRARPDNRPLVYSEVRSGECGRCHWRHTCAGGCPEHTRMVYGTVDHSSPWCALFMSLLPTYLRAVGNQIKRAVDGTHNDSAVSPRQVGECPQ